ncbi:MAG: hypothetical protein C0596_01085 [Marinilabiliales bacterium]|nr:MAG: hypothetical protein C0596_01085 [Marinilabiliales bacterium]
MANDSLSSEREKEILTEFMILMDVKKVYLQAGINLNLIAQIINTNRQYLSQTLNKHFNMNFNLIINKRRINDALILIKLDKCEKYTIESVANAVGFNNRTSFIAAFKAESGMTPSQYRKENCQSVKIDKS